jgi:hypothetical protein
MNMKTNPGSFNPNHAQVSVILLGLMAAGSIGVAVANFLALKEAEDASVFRANSWNNAILVTEAGIKKVLVMINPKTDACSSATAWTNNVSANGWTAISGNVYYLRRDVAPNYRDVFITNLNNQPVIQSVGTVNGVSASIGTIYASEADLSMSGGGNSTVNFR